MFSMPVMRTVWRRELSPADVSTQYTLQALFSMPVMRNVWRRELSPADVSTQYTLQAY